MCATAMQLGKQGALIRNITLFAVLIYEIVGPLMTREALTAAGDIRPKSEEIIKRRANKLAAVGSPQAAQAEAIAEETIKEEARAWDVENKRYKNKKK